MHGVGELITSSRPGRWSRVRHRTTARATTGAEPVRCGVTAQARVARPTSSSQTGQRRGQSAARCRSSGPSAGPLLDRGSSRETSTTRFSAPTCGPPTCSPTPPLAPRTTSRQRPAWSVRSIRATLPMDRAPEPRDDTQGRVGEASWRDHEDGVRGDAPVGTAKGSPVPWGRWATRPGTRRARSSVSIPLPFQGRTIGAFNANATRPQGVHRRRRPLPGSGLPADSRHGQRQGRGPVSRRGAGSTQAMTSRATIEQATGNLTEAVRRPTGERLTV
jgi:hypothetical protein